MADHQNNSKIGVHFFYVTLILLSVIVLLATTKWTELPKFTDYLSTAATITSLVLGLLAIIYAYISNDSLSQTTGVLNETAQEAQNATSKITHLVANVEDLTRGTSLSNEQLAQILGELKDQLKSLDGTAATLDTQANAIAAILPEIPKGLQKIEARFEAFALASPNVTADKKQTLSDEELEVLAKNCIQRSSAAGILLMTSCYLSFKTNKTFDLKKGYLDFDNGEYFYGYLIALEAVGIVRYTKNPESFQIQVTQCPEALSECEQAFESKVNNLTSDDQKERWTSALNAVKAHFAS